MCEIDVLPGLPELCRCTEVEELFSRFGKVDYLFIPPPQLRRSEPGFIKFWSHEGATAAFKASKEGMVLLHGTRVQLEYHKAPLFAGRSMGDGCGGSTSSRPPDPPPMIAWTQNSNPEVDDFVRRHNLCAKAEGELRELPLADQLAMIRKPYKDIRSMDAVVISQSRSLKGKEQDSARAQFGSGRPGGRTGRRKGFKGSGFARGQEQRQLVKNTGENDKRLDRFIQINKLDDDCTKVLQRHSKEVQAAVIDCYLPDLTIKGNHPNNDGRTFNPSAIVVSKVKREREKILDKSTHGIRLKESQQAGSRSPGASPRRRRSSSDDDRSRSRSSHRRSRSEDSSSGRSQRPQDDDGGPAPEGVDIVGAEAQGNEDRGRRSAPHRSVSLSRSRSDSRSMEPKNEGQGSQPQRRVVVSQAEESREEDNSSPLVEVSNMPDLTSRGKNPLQYFPDLFNPTLKTLPDFNKETGGESVLKAWNKPGKVGAILLQLQNKALAVSAARTLNGLEFLGYQLKVHGIPKPEADGLLHSAP